ncbi:MAG: energy-coupling factor transporter ATPase [Actinomycetota bacterium]|nr:energy-coupling factor transporter ATPase [Actinomycetota bacterium]
MIDIKNISYVYLGRESEQSALKDLSLKIEEGEFLSVVGRNGSGKSTLAKVLGGLFTPTSGEFILDGVTSAEPENIWRHRRLVGMIFQNPESQIVATTVEDDVAFGPENLGLDPKEIRERVDESLAMVNLTDLERFEPHLLSGGEKQRLAIAGVLAMKPKYLVLDEPTSMLDPKGRRDLMEIIKKLNKEQGVAVILITHRMEEAAMAERIVALDNGAIQADLLTREFFASSALIEGLALDVPFAIGLSDDLKRAGLNLPKILTAQELVEAICSLS